MKELTEVKGNVSIQFNTEIQFLGITSSILAKKMPHLFSKLIRGCGTFSAKEEAFFIHVKPRDVEGESSHANHSLILL